MTEHATLYKAYDWSQAEEALFQSVPDLLSANRSTQKRTAEFSLISIYKPNRHHTVYIDLGPAQGQTAKIVMEHPYRLGKSSSQYYDPGKQAVCHLVWSHHGFRFRLFRVLPGLGNQGQLYFQIDAIVKGTGRLLLALVLTRDGTLRRKKGLLVQGLRLSFLSKCPIWTFKLPDKCSLTNSVEFGSFSPSPYHQWQITFCHCNCVCLSGSCCPLPFYKSWGALSPHREGHTTCAGSLRENSAPILVEGKP